MYLYLKYTQGGNTGRRRRSVRMLASAYRGNMVRLSVSVMKHGARKKPRAVCLPLLPGQEELVVGVPVSALLVLLPHVGPGHGRRGLVQRRQPFLENLRWFT